jgi:hypothetical protein
LQLRKPDLERVLTTGYQPKRRFVARARGLR